MHSLGWGTNDHHSLQNCHGTMRFGSTAKVLARCKLKYYRISECMVWCRGDQEGAGSLLAGNPHSSSLQYLSCYGPEPGTGQERAAWMLSSLPGSSSHGSARIVTGMRDLWKGAVIFLPGPLPCPLVCSTCRVRPKPGARLMARSCKLCGTAPAFRITV